MKTIVLISSVILFGTALVKTGPLPAGRPEERLRAVYLSQLGVREATNRNDGPQVEAYLRYVGLKAGSPWCAAFVSWCLGQADIANPRSGYCPDFFRAGKVVWEGEFKVESRKFKVERGGKEGAKELKVESLKLKVESLKLKVKEGGSGTGPSRGDVFGIYFPEKGRIAHVGFVDDWGDKYVVTVEGNTNEAGSREGDGVYRKRRLISSLCKVARYCPDKGGVL